MLFLINNKIAWLEPKILTYLRCCKNKTDPYGATTSFCTVYSEHSQTSKIEIFSKIIINGYFYEKLHLTCFAGFWICLCFGILLSLLLNRIPTVQIITQNSKPSSKFYTFFSNLFSNLHLLITQMNVTWNIYRAGLWRLKTKRKSSAEVFNH